jgi:hypothetical protein
MGLPGKSWAKTMKLFVSFVLFALLAPSMMISALLGVKPYCYMLLEGQKVSFGVHPDALITEKYSLQDGTAVHVIVGEVEQDKLFALQKILDEED